MSGVSDIGTPGWRPTEVHPLAELFPMLSPDDFASLVEHIKEHGLQNPIVIDDDGVLIDGRMRLAACEEAGVEPRYERLNGHDPVAYIWGANGKRRQMTKGQMAMLAAWGANVCGMRNSTHYDAEMPSNRQLAKLAGVSSKTMDKAMLVREHRYDLCEQVVVGRMTLDEAYGYAQKSQRDAEWLKNGLALLRDEDADLAHRVAEGELTIDAARQELDERKRAAEAVRDSTFLGLANLTRSGANFEKSSGLVQIREWLGTEDGHEHLRRYFKGGVKELRQELQAARRGLDAAIAACGGE